jgi:hypothetical protein
LFTIGSTILVDLSELFRLHSRTSCKLQQFVILIQMTQEMVKRKVKKLSVAETMAAIQMLDDGTAQKHIAHTFGVTEAAISNLKKRKHLFKQQLSEEQDSQAAKRAKVGYLPLLEQSLLNWFRRVRSAKVQVSLAMLKSKSLEISSLLLKNASDNLPEDEKERLSTFKASKGFLDKFCKRHKVVGLDLKMNLSTPLEVVNVNAVLFQGSRRGRQRRS